MNRTPVTTKFFATGFVNNRIMVLEPFVLLLLLGPAPAEAQPLPPTSCMPDSQIINLFVPLDYAIMVDNQEAGKVTYRLFEPTGRTGDRKFPLIIWLHHHGTVECDPKKATGFMNHLGAVIPDADRRKSPFYLLAVRCPSGTASWAFVSATRERGGVNVDSSLLTRQEAARTSVFPTHAARMQETVTTRRLVFITPGVTIVAARLRTETSTIQHTG